MIQLKLGVPASIDHILWYSSLLPMGTDGLWGVSSLKDLFRKDPRVLLALTLDTAGFCELGRSRIPSPLEAEDGMNF